MSVCPCHKGPALTTEPSFEKQLEPSCEDKSSKIANRLLCWSWITITKTLSKIYICIQKTSNRWRGWGQQFFERANYSNRETCGLHMTGWGHEVETQLWEGIWKVSALSRIFVCNSCNCMKLSEEYRVESLSWIGRLYSTPNCFTGYVQVFRGTFVTQENELRCWPIWEFDIGNVLKLVFIMTSCEFALLEGHLAVSRKNMELNNNDGMDRVSLY